MNQNLKQQLKATASFAIVVGISALLLWAMNSIATAVRDSRADDELVDRYEGLLDSDMFRELEITEAGPDFDAVAAAYEGRTNGHSDGFIIELSVDGYNGKIPLSVSVSADAKRVIRVRVGENSETENLGGKVADSAFISQFTGASAPFVLGSAKLKDGVYHAQEDDFGSDGWQESVTLTVIDGRIGKAYWDAVPADGGKSKREASMEGEYIMTETGLLWHEQAQLLEARLVELQNPSRFVMSEDGKTDAITGVSISVSSFVALAQECYEQAGGGTEGTGIDAVSQATVSSQAVVDGVNLAVRFSREYLLGELGGMAVDGADE